MTKTNPVFNINDFENIGFSRLFLPKELVVFLENKIKTLSFEDYPSDVLLEHKDWESRKVVKDLQQNQYRIVVEFIKEQLKDYLKFHYLNLSKIPYSIGVFKGEKNYHMTWHNDIISGSPIFALIYLYEDRKPSNSGALCVRKVERDEEGQVVNEVFKNCMIPQHGQVFVLQNKNILFEHMAEPYLEDHNRFYIPITLGTKEF